MLALNRLSRAVAILGLSLMVAACNSKGAIAPTVPQPTEMQTVEPTLPPTVGLTATPSLPTVSPTLQSTETPRPAGSATPFSTSTPTVVPLAVDDQFRADLEGQNYRFVFGASTIGPKGFTYSSYLFTDTKLQPYQDGKSSPEICRIAFYRLDGNGNTLLGTFGAPTYLPQWTSAYPVLCQPINWDNPDALLGGILTPASLGLADDETHKLLGLQGYWSDINQNGLPEFALYSQYCPNACTNEGEVSTHFYEIQDTATVVDITADLPGVFHPWSFVHSIQPLDFYLYDPTLNGTLEFLPHAGIESFWIYAWEGNQFIDKTSQYAELYSIQIDEQVKGLQENYYGQPLNHTLKLYMYEILVLSNKASLPRKATLDKFLEVTDLSHWPGTEPEGMCWLQVSRAYAQTAYEHNQPFSFPPINYFSGMLSEEELQQQIDLGEHDVSACNEFLIP